MSKIIIKLQGEWVKQADPHIGILYSGTEKLIEFKIYLQTVIVSNNTTSATIQKVNNFHLVKSSPWPILLSFSLCLTLIFIILWLHEYKVNNCLFLPLSIFLSLFSLISWLWDVVIAAAVKRGLQQDSVVKKGAEVLTKITIQKIPVVFIPLNEFFAVYQNWFFGVGLVMSCWTFLGFCIGWERLQKIAANIVFALLEILYGFCIFGVTLCIAIAFFVNGEAMYNAFLEFQLTTFEDNWAAAKELGIIFVNVFFLWPLVILVKYMPPVLLPIFFFGGP